MVERESREKDVGQIVRYLTTTFNQATSKLERPFRTSHSGPNLSYRLQTEFAYLLNELTQGPRCMLQKHITDCNEFIDSVVQDLGRQ